MKTSLQTTLAYLFVLVAFCLSADAFSQTGTVTGTFTNEKGEPAAFVNIVLEGTAADGTAYGVGKKVKGTSTDIDGKYTLASVPAGTYRVKASSIEFADYSGPEFTIKAGETITQNATLGSGAVNIGEFEKVDRLTQNTDGDMGRMRKAASISQDGLSGAAIQESGQRTAAESAKLITGASVVGGKYVYVRGLGDRYTAAQMNGASLISTDPYVNSAPLDLIPSNLLANMIVAKTASANLPGSFSGGVVQLNTKDYPDSLTFSFTSGLSYNPQASFNPEFLTYEGGKTDWLGYDDGTRALDPILQNEDNLDALSAPTYYIIARTDDEAAELLDNASNALSRQMEATRATNFTNYNVGFSFGNKYKLFGKELGLIMGANHSKSYTHYNNGVNQAWDLTSGDAEELFSYYDLSDNRSVENPVVSYMAGLTYRLGKNHSVGLFNLYNHDTEKLARFQSGTIPGIISGSDVLFETRTLQFTERGLNTTQLKGDHILPIFNQAKVEWVAAYTNSFQHEPDLRFFANENVGDSAFFISVSEYDLPNHFWRFLEDEALEFAANLTVPLDEEADKSENTLQFGYRVMKKTRNFNEFRFQIRSRDGVTYQGDEEEYFGEANTGVIGYDSVFDRNIIGNYLFDNTKPSNNYSGSEFVAGYYGMANFKITPRWRGNAGVRAEQTIMNIASGDTTLDEGNINQWNFFPSVNLTFAQSEKTNIRMAFSQTIARPTMRELAPFVTFDFIGGFLYLGNPDLVTTTINNYDLRWEHFMTSGEVVSASVYYKHFENPIVQAYNTNAINPEVIFQNTNDADVFGIEMEFKKKLGFISDKLTNYSLNTNFSYIFSRVAIDTAEFNALAAINPEISAYRPFQGQSPFLANFVLSYNNADKRLGANLNCNVFGDRLSAIGLRGLPDVYDRGRAFLNFSINKSFGDHLNLKAGVNNILNTLFVTQQTFRSSVYVNESRRLGRSYSLSLRYTIQ